MTLQQPHVRAEIEALVAHFAWLVDHEDGHGVPELFAPDGVYGFEFGAMEGREAIAGFYEWRRSGRPRTSRHVFTNLHLRSSGDGAAAATCVLTLHAADGDPPLPLDPVMVADYDDEFVRGRDGVWRFARRQVTLVFGSFPHMRGDGD